MCDEVEDRFADEIFFKSPEDYATLEWALREWNRAQPTTQPVKSWARLMVEEKLQVCHIEAQLIEKIHALARVVGREAQADLDALVMRMAAMGRAASN